MSRRHLPQKVVCVVKESAAETCSTCRLDVCLLNMAYVLAALNLRQVDERLSSNDLRADLASANASRIRAVTRRPAPRAPRPCAVNDRCFSGHSPSDCVVKRNGGSERCRC